MDAYERLTWYILNIGLPWDERDPQIWQAGIVERMEFWAALLGPPGKVLDCSCGRAGDAIALARLGWQVSASDLSPISIEIARQRAARLGVQLDLHLWDMRTIEQLFNPGYDWVINCFALYEISEDAGIHRALQAMYNLLKPGGKCYIRLRDMDNLLAEQTRHEFHGEQPTEHGRVICIEDWDYESATHVIQMYAFLTEDTRYAKDDYRRWSSETLALPKRVIRKAELDAWLRAVGFESVQFLPQPSPWHPYAVIAEKMEIR